MKDKVDEISSTFLYLKCTLHATHSASNLKKMEESYNNQSAKIAQLRIVAALTPVIGNLLATTAGLISSETGLRGSALVKKEPRDIKQKNIIVKKLIRMGIHGEVMLNLNL